MAIPSKIETLQTDRLILKQVNPEHYPSYHRHINDYEVIKYLSSKVPWPYPENGVKEYLENIIGNDLGSERWLWGIFLKNNPNEVIGAIELWRKSCPENRGFWLGKDYWNQGYMTEAADIINHYAFTKLKFDKLIFSNASQNIGSRRIKEKTGAKLIGTRGANFVSPEFTIAETWELTKENWNKTQTTIS